MARGLVVEVKPLGAVAQVHQAALAVDPLGRPRTRAAPAAFVRELGLQIGVGGGFQRVAAEAVQQVHQQQLLVLLLVLQPQLQQLRIQCVPALLEGGGDPLAPAQHLGDGGSGEQPPLGPRLPLPHRLVVAVEQVAPAAVRRLIAHQALQQKLLEKPGGVA